jgi:hypothetical protein
MIMWASGLGIGVARLSRVMRRVEELGMPDVVLDTTRQVESVCEDPPGVIVLRPHVPSVATRACIECHSIVDGVEVKRCGISATPQLFSEDKGVEF